MVIFKIENSIFNSYIMLLLLKFCLIRTAHPRFTSEISYKCHLDSHQLLFFFSAYNKWGGGIRTQVLSWE